MSDHIGQPWPRPPFALDKRHLCMVTDAEHLSVLDSRTGETTWTYSARNPVSLTGEALQAVGNGATLLILVSRNSTYDLECFDARTGIRRWSKTHFRDTQSVDLDGGTLDAETVYLMQGNRLRAYALADGRLLYSVSLPARAGHWQVLRTQHCLICLPRNYQAVQWQLRWLFATAQLWLSAAPSLEPERLLAVFLCNPRTGRLLQRLNLAAPAQRGDWSGSLDSSFVLLPRLSRKFLSVPEAGPVLKISERGMMLEWREQAWGFRAYRPSPLDPAPQKVQQ
jgi:hypothetical protein